MTCLTKSLFLRDYWTKSGGVFAGIWMQIISSRLSFVILTHFQINLQFWKILLKVRSYFFLTIGSIDQFGFKSMASAIPGGLPRQTKDDAMPQAYTCSWTKAVHSLKYSSFVMLLEAPQIWRMKRYNVLETELVYKSDSETKCRQNTVVKEYSINCISHEHDSLFMFYCNSFPEKLWRLETLSWLVWTFARGLRE